jgi:hypothetical protein
VKKPPAKKPIAKKPPSIAKLNAIPIPAPPAPFWNRWTFRLLIGGVVAITGGAFAMVNLRSTCPPGTAICVHGRGLTTVENGRVTGFPRALGIDGGSLSVHHSEIDGFAGKP